jgi:ABC-2 type transport system permease protein
VLFGLGGLLYDLHISGAPLALAATAAAFSLCVVSMGLALLAICKTLMQMNALANLGAIVLAGLGGAIAPSSALPGWASSIAPATPSYWAMRGFRSVILDGGGFSEVALPMAVLLGFAVAFSAVAVSRLKFEETKTAWA